MNPQRDMFTGPNPSKIDENLGTAINAPQSTVTINNAASTQPLRALPPAPHQHFTGREDDLTKLRSMLSPNATIAITAFGGMGKTALALELAERIKDQFSGGVLWAELVFH